jgi:hypothetical protein
MTDKLKTLLATFSDNELLWLRGRLNDKGLSPERRVAHCLLIESIGDELIRRRSSK